FRTTLDTEFLQSAAFRRLLDLAGQLREIGAGPYSLVRGEGDDGEQVATPARLLERIL
ncbi:MAG: hypothetical protein HKP30_09185, partial [Myxococcales bacterium]|nr:hypothetical protein [Myxococcales bacterium]